MLETVGRYHLEGRLGDGAMADVYRAFDPQISRPLAVKLLKAEFLRDRQYADRFLREAKAAGALSHPNIVTVYDVGEANSTPYIVMELLEGWPLDKILAEGALDPITTLKIGIQLADALAFAHAQRVIHRDIKPSNIIVAPDGHSVKLLDFGIARVGDALFDSESVRTQVGQVLGTPRYMSPEQAVGGEIDGRSDLFSVGTVLYEMLSGRRAFRGTTSATLAIEIIQRDPEPLSAVAPTTPGGLQFIVSKLLAKQPALRFADGRQLADAMRKELAALTAVGAEATSRPSYLPIQVRLPVTLGVITAVVLGVAIFTVLTRQYAAMQKVALASGNAISSFVASNAALRAVENSTLPTGQQDWVPVEAFVRSASADPTIRRIVVVGAGGTVHAATDPTMIGRTYAEPKGGTVVVRRDDVTVFKEDRPGATGAFRFLRPIVYAGQNFGEVDVEISNSPLEEAARLGEILLAGLGVITVGGVALTSYFGARALARPLRRTSAALREVAGGNLDFRISHSRRDEFGELFDTFNLAASALQDRIQSTEHLALDTPLSPSPEQAEAVSAPANSVIGSQKVFPGSADAGPVQLPATVASAGVVDRSEPSATPAEPPPMPVADFAADADTPSLSEQAALGAVSHPRLAAASHTDDHDTTAESLASAAPVSLSTDFDEDDDVEGTVIGPAHR